MAADWGKDKYNYYYTDYVDNDYPTKLTQKEENLANIEQEEALRAQKKLLSTLEQVNLDLAYDEDDKDDTLEFLKEHNVMVKSSLETTNKRKRVAFQVEDKSEQESEDVSDHEEEKHESRKRPINMHILKNRGLTPYKKKAYRNPRVKHKLKYKKAMSKRRRVVIEAKTPYHRYSGESAGIKTSTIKSIRLC